MSVRRSVRRSVGPYLGPLVPCYFRTTIMAVFKGKKTSNDIKKNGKMSEDEVGASDVPPGYLFFPMSLSLSLFCHFLILPLLPTEISEVYN